MKANEAPKSKFVYPDKLYARTNDNITLDISYAPQILEAVEYIRKDAFIEKAYNWLEQTLSPYVPYCDIDIDLAVENFRKYMKEE